MPLFMLAAVFAAFGLGHSVASEEWQWSAFFALSTTIWCLAAVLPGREV